MSEPVDNLRAEQRDIPSQDAILDTLAATVTEDYFSADALLQLALKRAQDGAPPTTNLNASDGTPPLDRSALETDADDSPRISRVNLAVRLPEIFPDDATRSRYIIGEVLGEGATGRHIQTR